MTAARKLLGEILIENQICTEEQIQEALRSQEEQGGAKKIGEILIEMGHAKAKDVTRAISKQTGIPIVDLKKTKIPPQVINLLDPKVVREHRIVPVRKKGNTYTVVMSDPLDFNTLDNLRFILSAEIQPLISTKEDIDQAIDRYYGIGQQEIDNLAKELDGDTMDVGVRQASDGGTDGADDDAPVIRMVHEVILDAIKMGASDIHLEAMEKKFRRRYRIDGICLEMDPLPKKLQAAITSRVKIMAKIDIAEKRRPTDGRIKVNLSGRDFDLRVSCLPTTYGESVVMRILDHESVMVGIDKLGFSDLDLKTFYNLIKRPNGIFLVTGPTGSGKTTTLYTALQQLNQPDKKIITAEDPVEYMVTGINQCEVKERIGLGFGRVLRAMLRQAPNIILVGEIRDSETAEIAIQAALTGHLVFSTLHTNDAPSSITRLVDIGIKPFLVASALIAAMAQRLVRKVCLNCKAPYEEEARRMRALSITPEMVQGITLYKGMGCERCKGTGCKGRMGIFEFMVVNNRIREMAFQGATAHELRRQARNNGMTTLLEDGVLKILNGSTTVDEVLSACQAEIVTD